MHLRYFYDVKEYLTIAKNNNIIINFESAVKVAESLSNNQSRTYPIPPKCVPSSYNGECHVNHIRKMQASFAWDWGPAFPVAGLWNIPQLITFNDSTLFDTTVDIELAEGFWSVTVTAHLENAPSSPSKPVVGTLVTSLMIAAPELKGNPWIGEPWRHDPGEFTSNSTTFRITNNQKTSFLSVIMRIPESKISRWWPSGYGDQNLYKLNITLMTPSHSECKIRSVGFRTIKLVQEPLKKGLTFYFKVNDVPIFAKGTNMIPSSILTGESNRRIASNYLLTHMKMTHQNMVRLWGGGIYESDDFYDSADTYGIMIWQDFMFACAMYPTTPDFLASVREEVKQTVSRLKSHPSVVLWAGNNENEAALYGNWYGTGNEKVYKDDYIKLYIDLIKTEVEENDKSRPFLASSPTNADYSAQNGWIESNPYSNIYGDIHYYNYIANGWDINTYKRPRFSSEYGFQSLPSIKTLKEYSKNPEIDLVLGSDFLKHRQHLPGGDAFMNMQIKMNLRIPDTGDSQRDFQNYIYLSQIQQAVAVKIQTESYRQAKSDVNEIGEGMTMGALYWQLNDVWAAPSWSSIDVAGRWKMLHYYAEEFFAPVVVNSRLTFDKLTIFIVSDDLVEIVDCHVEMNFHRIWNGTMPQIHTKLLDKVTVPGNSAVELPTLSLQEVLKEASCGLTFEEAKTNCIIELILRSSSNKQLAPINYVYPAPLKELDLPVCNLKVSVSAILPWSKHDHMYNHYWRSYNVTITSNCTQLFVWFDGDGFGAPRFSENGFHLLKGSKTIFLLAESTFGMYQLPDITVTTLGFIYATPPPCIKVLLNCRYS
ncbi:beta-mannosidase isoform X2 [Diachasmimorpha longicaudata]